LPENLTLIFSKTSRFSPVVNYPWFCLNIFAN